MGIELDPTRRTLVPAVVLGIGLGAFVDGIVLHQLLGWHHTLLNVGPPHGEAGLRFNMVWDGLFQVLAWFATAAGIVMLWRAGLAGRVPGVRRFVGGLLTGFAAFNLVEAVLDRHLLELNNLREAAHPIPWNIGFLVVSAAVLVIGLALAQARPSSSSRLAGVRPR